MNPKKNDKQSGAERQATIQEMLQERLRLAIRHTMITVLEEVVSEFIQAALYERSERLFFARENSTSLTLKTRPGENGRQDRRFAGAAHTGRVPDEIV